MTVQPSYRRRGLLTQMMQHQLADIVERGIEPVALLWASESSIYGRFGYGPATSRHKVSRARPVDGVSTGGRSRSGSVGEVERDEVLPIIADLRRGLLPQRVGALDRSDAWSTVRWHDPEPWRDGASAYRFALHYATIGQAGRVRRVPGQGARPARRR